MSRGPDAPEETVIPPLLEDSGWSPDQEQDLGQLYPLQERHKEREERRRRSQAIMARVRAEEAQATPAPAEAPASPEGDEEAKLRAQFEAGGMSALGASQRLGAAAFPGVAKEAAAATGSAIVDTPLQVVAGAIDAVRNTGDLARELNNAVGSIPGIGQVLGGGIRTTPPGTLWPIEFVSADEIKNTETFIRGLTPDVENARTKTGQLARGAARFVTGYLATGRIKPLVNLAQMGTAGRIASPLVRGALADFATVDPSEENLANFLAKHTALGEVLAPIMQNPDDPDLLNRARESLIGMGLGAVTDSFVGVVRAVVKGRQLREAAEATGDAEGFLKEVEEVFNEAAKKKASMDEVLGDPSAPAFQLRELTEEEAQRALQETGQDPRVAINFSRIESPDDVKDLIQKMADAFSGDIEGAARGTRTWQQSKLSASQKDAFDILLERRPGTPLSAEDTVAVRELWVRSAEKLKGVTDALSQDPESTLNRIAFRRMLTVHRAIQEQVIAARTETARALNIWRMPSGDLGDFINRMDDLEAIARADHLSPDLARRLKSLTDADLVREGDSLIYASRWAKTKDAIAQAYYFSMLSSPVTHIRNIAGNASMIAQQITERRVAAAYGKLIGDQKVADEESMDMLFGAIRGVQDAMRVSSRGRRALVESAKRVGKGDFAGANQVLADAQDEFGNVYTAFATGRSSQGGVGKIEDVRALGARPDRVGIDEGSALGRVFRLIGSLPGRSLVAGDEFFRSTAYHAQIAALARRQARSELAQGIIQPEQMRTRAMEILADPDRYMKLASSEFSRVSTFTNVPVQSPMWRAWQGVSQIPILGKLTIPFVKTPYNIAAQVHQRTPIAPFLRSWQKEFQKGGADADLAITKMVTGSAVLLALGDLADRGFLTGQGPPSRTQRETERRVREPESIVIERADGTTLSISYTSLEPISAPLSIAANTVEILNHIRADDDLDDEIEGMVLANALAIAGHVTENAMMTGISTLADVISDEKRYGEGYFRRLAGLASPNIAAQIARVQDPVVRDANSYMDQIRRRVPGLSDELPPMRDAWGQVIRQDSGIGGVFDFLTPMRVREKDLHPIDRELIRLGKFVGRPSKKRFSVDGISINMENFPEAWSRYLELQGEAYKGPVAIASLNGRGYVSMQKGLVNELNDIVTGEHPYSPIYEQMSDGPDGTKAQYIQVIINAHRNAAKAQLLKEFPELQSEINSRKADRPPAFRFMDQGNLR